MRIDIPTVADLTNMNHAHISAATGGTTVRLPRLGTQTDSSQTPTIDTDAVDLFSITGQTADITSFTTNLSGAENSGQTLIIQITGTASRALAWGTKFESSGDVTLPTTTSSTTMLSVGFIYNLASHKWTCVAGA